MLVPLAVLVASANVGAVGARPALVAPRLQPRWPAVEPLGSAAGGAAERSPLRAECATGGLERSLALRGGDAGGMVQSVQNAYLGIPIVTRSWLTLILVFACGAQLNEKASELVALDSGAIVRGGQVWRMLTCACFFGGLGPQLLQKLYYLIQFGRGLETTLGRGEYLRFLASSTAAMAILFNPIGWKFVGDGLVMAVTVICTLQSPEQSVNMYGLNIPYAYLPFAQLVMSYMFSQQIPWQDIVGAIVGYGHYYFNDNLKPDSAVPQLLKPAKGSKGAGRTLGGSGAPKRKTGRKAKTATMASVADCGPGG